MLLKRQEEILGLLKEYLELYTHDLEHKMKITRSRINQLIAPLISKGLVKREGKARATKYRLSDKQSIEQLRRENWELRKSKLELEKALEDRKVIERAKEIIMAEFDILPTEAYRKLQLQSMETGRSMRKIADSILSVYETYS